MAFENKSRRFLYIRDLEDEHLQISLAAKGGCRHVNEAQSTELWDIRLIKKRLFAQQDKYTHEYGFSGGIVGTHITNKQKKLLPYELFFKIRKYKPPNKGSTYTQLNKKNAVISNNGIAAFFISTYFCVLSIVRVYSDGISYKSVAVIRQFYAFLTAPKMDKPRFNLGCRSPPSPFVFEPYSKIERRKVNEYFAEKQEIQSNKKL